MIELRSLLISSLIINLLILYYTYMLVQSKSNNYYQNSLSEPKDKGKLKFLLNPGKTHTAVKKPDDDRILNIIHFKFLLNTPPRICRNNEKGQIVVIASSFIPPVAFRERHAIRKTWASVKEYKNFAFQTLFFIGQTNGSSEEDFFLYKELAKESEVHKDLVMGNFLDSYKNLTYKRLMSSKWILDHCQTAQYILKIDDEWFADTFRVLDLIDQMIPHFVSTLSSHFACELYIRDAPIRDSEYYLNVKKEDYSRSMFPDYCLGPASISTIQALRKEYSVRHEIPFFWAEDIFHTGLLREYYELVNNEEIRLWPLNNGHLYLMNDPGFQRGWCSHPQKEKYMGSEPFQWIFIEMKRGAEFINDITCLWNKTLEVKRHMESKIKPTKIRNFN